MKIILPYYNYSLLLLAEKDYYPPNCITKHFARLQSMANSLRRHVGDHSQFRGDKIGALAVFMASLVNLSGISAGRKETEEVKFSVKGKR